MVICALAAEIFKTMVMRSWPNITFMGHTSTFVFMAPSSMDKNIKNYILQLHCYKNAYIAIRY